MMRVPPWLVLLATLSALAGVIAVDSPLAIAGLSLPAALAVLASTKGRRTFARRLLVTAPLIIVGMALRWCTQETIRDSLLAALRVSGALAWASCLSTWLEPRALRAALRALDAPSALLELIAHTQRFAVQLAETASEAWNAAALRAGLHSLRAATGTVGHVAGVIVVRAFDRAERVAIASALRGDHLAEERLLEASPASQSLGCRP